MNKTIIDALRQFLLVTSECDADEIANAILHWDVADYITDDGVQQGVGPEVGDFLTYDDSLMNYRQHKLILALSSRMAQDRAEYKRKHS